MVNIKISRRVRLKEPIMLVAWPGMGNVALRSMDYLRKKLGAVLFAEVDTSQLWTPEMVVVKKGLATLPKPPKNFFYYTKQPDLIIFEGEAQFSGRTGRNLIEEILDLAREFKVRKIYTGAAFPLPQSYKEASAVYGATNAHFLRNSLRRQGVRIMEGGQISGLNGLLLGYAEQRGIEACCLLATMPHYAVNLPNPKASKAIIEVLQKILKVRINMEGLSEPIIKIEKKMALIEEKVGEVFPLVEEEIEIPSLGSEKIPNGVMEKIERLFQESRVDRKKACFLKEELDRWNLYKLYEDRFLDLFESKE
jgi:proteasome assembly chaperone (PAC2) family protein